MRVAIFAVLLVAIPAAGPAQDVANYGGSTIDGGDAGNFTFRIREGNEVVLLTGRTEMAHAVLNGPTSEVETRSRLGCPMGRLPPPSIDRSTASVAEGVFRFDFESTWFAPCNPRVLETNVFTVHYEINFTATQCTWSIEFIHTKDGNFVERQTPSGECRVTGRLLAAAT